MATVQNLRAVQSLDNSLANEGTESVPTKVLRHGVDEVNLFYSLVVLIHIY